MMTLFDELAEAAADFVAEVYEGVRRGSQKVMARQREPKCSAAIPGTSERCNKPAKSYRLTNGIELLLCKECHEKALW